MKRPKLSAPFPWFGGKSRAAPLIWERLGKIDNYVEPFAGSLAVLLGSPSQAHTETINDLDGFIANFWRAISRSPDEVAHYADYPVSEADKTARHLWLVKRRKKFTSRLQADPDYYDAKIAGWWCWGICCWIGGDWCSGNGPWKNVDGLLVHIKNKDPGVSRQLPILGNVGVGVTRQCVHSTKSHEGKYLYEWFAALGERLARVRVCCGDWKRVCGPSVTVLHGITAVVLDPPYSMKDRSRVYVLDSGTVAAECRDWALSVGTDPRMRIVLCGYDTEHTMPGWTRVKWKAQGGYAGQGDGSNINSSRETLWFSPHCLGESQESMFGDFSMHKLKLF